MNSSIHTGHIGYHHQQQEQEQVSDMSDAVHQGVNQVNETQFDNMLNSQSPTPHQHHQDGGGGGGGNGASSTFNSVNEVSDVKSQESLDESVTRKEEDKDEMNGHFIQDHGRTPEYSIPQQVVKPIQDTEGAQFSNMSMQDLPYMTEEDLDDFIRDSALDLTRHEIQYLKMKRRRMSIDEHGGQVILDNELYPFIKTEDCKNSFPFKVVTIGDEDTSGKQNIVNMLTASIAFADGEGGQGGASSTASSSHLCDIQTRVINISDKRNQNDSITGNYALQLWMPDCSEDCSFLRPLMYRSTDVFVVVFSIKDAESFQMAKDVYLPELKSFIESFDDDRQVSDDVAEFHQDIPILLVGNHAEYRTDPTFQGNLVTAEEAVQLAQSNGVGKYVEIFSDNLFHVHEIFHQAVIAAVNNQKEMSLTEEEIFNLKSKDDAYFREMLTVATPQGSFDQLERTFSMEEPEEGVQYFYTVDGTSPTKSSSPFTGGSIPLRKPLPKEIRVIGFRRGWFSSEEARFKVPRESKTPEGYFDTHTRTFRIVTLPDTDYFVNLDGTVPNRENGIQYDVLSNGIPLDDNDLDSMRTVPNSSFSAGPVKIPDIVKVIAIERDKLRSRVATFHPPTVLPTPTMYINERVLKVDTIPGIIYKYTLDGTDPTWDSTTYTAPVLLPADASINTVKVAAFPRFAFPSRVAELSNVDLSSKAPKESARHAVRMTNSALMSRRTASPRTYTINGSQSPPRTMDDSHGFGTGSFGNALNSSSASPGRLIGFGSGVERGLYNRSPARDRISSSSPQRARSPRSRSTSSPEKGLRPQRTLQAPLTIKEQESMVHRKALFRKRRTGSPSPIRPQKSREFPVSESKVQERDRVRQTIDSSSKSELVKCKAEGTNVEFTFAEPVSVSSVHIKTPGSGQGPVGYECFVIDEDTATATSIGAGDLVDQLAMQSLVIDASKFQSSGVKKLLCSFRMAPGQTAFRILDMKIDCKKLS